MTFPESKGKLITHLMHKSLLHVVLLIVISAAVYLNSLSHDFVFDDMGTIVENKYIKDLRQNLPSFFNTTYFKISGGEASYRPIATLAYFLIYTISNLNPFGYHLGSLLFHTVNVILVYVLVNLIQKNKTTSLIAGLLFALHPVLTEAVNCISFNEDLLTTLFFIVSLLLYSKVKADDAKPRIQLYFLALLFFLLALLSKEMAITLPAIILLYDLTFREFRNNRASLKFIKDTIRDRKYYYLGYIATAVFYLSLRFIFLTNPKASATGTYGSLAERIIYLPDHIFSFIKLVFFPLNLNADYIFSYPESPFEIVNIVSFIILVGLIGFSFYVYKGSKEVSFGIWWFFVTLLPVSNLIEIMNPLADRYLYLPTVGFCIAISNLFVKIPSKISLLNINKPKIVGFFVFLLVVFYSLITINRNGDWKDNFSLWSATLKRSPNSPGAHSNLGRVYLEQGLLEAAIHEFETAIKIDPGAYKAHYNLGVAYEKQGLYEEAIHHYKKVVRINPKYVDAYYNLANIFTKRGLLPQAAAAYRKVIELEANDFEARNNLGVVYAMQGQLDKAIQEWGKVLEIDPQNQNAIENLKKAKNIKNQTK